jgi:hypothetical protein
MGIVSVLKRAEEHARKAAQSGMQRTIVALDDAERAVRRRMRIYPHRIPAVRAKAAKPSGATPAPSQESKETPTAKVS